MVDLSLSINLNVDPEHTIDDQIPVSTCIIHIRITRTIRLGVGTIR